MSENATPHVEMYTQWGCPYCSRAKALFDKNDIAYTEYDVTMGGKLRAEMAERAPGSRTVPQIFINGKSIGGCDDLMALNAKGELAALLGK